MTRREYLACYDYGQGGIWLYLLAESEEQIHARFPELTIVNTRPEWLGPEHEARIRKRRTIDIDDEANEFLASLIADRSNG